MRQKLFWLPLLLAAIGFATLYYAVRVHATPSVGFTATTIAQGKFGDIQVSNSFPPLRPTQQQEEGPNSKLWLSQQRTEGASDLYVQNNVWQPGGSTGWHTHPGHSLIIVTEGTVTVYEANDPGCKPHEYSAGTGFVDSGGDHVHTIVNKTNAEARTVAVQLVPAGQPRRIDAAKPENCTF